MGPGHVPTLTKRGSQALRWKVVIAEVFVGKSPYPAVSFAFIMTQIFREAIQPIADEGKGRVV